MFRPRRPLIPWNLKNLPSRPGVYIIYRADGSPFYVGRSSVSVRDRLCCHATRSGSRKVREALDRGEMLSFEWEEMSSPHQAEAQLIAALGTRTAGNLTRETDPADW